MKTAHRRSDELALRHPSAAFMGVGWHRAQHWYLTDCWIRLPLYLMGRWDTVLFFGDYSSMFIIGTFYFLFNYLTKFNHSCLNQSSNQVNQNRNCILNLIVVFSTTAVSIFGLLLTIPIALIFATVRIELGDVIKQMNKKRRIQAALNVGEDERKRRVALIERRL